MARVIILHDNKKQHQEPPSVIPWNSHFFRVRDSKHRQAITNELDLNIRRSGGWLLAKRDTHHETPILTSRLEDQWHHHDDTVSLVVNYKAHPEPTVKWFKEQQPIVPTMRTMIYISDKKTELVILDAQKSDSGFYTCRIENSCGVRETNCQVYIGDNERLKAKGSKTLIGNTRVF